MLAVALWVIAAAPPPASPSRPAISAAELRAHIKFLASDLLEGRGPASAGDRLAQQYIASQFELMGLEPGAPDGGWIQQVELVGVNGHPETMKAQGPTSALTLKSRDDFIVVSGHQEKTSAIESAPLVFAGYGITAPEYQWDDFKGVELTGKVLVMMNNDPEDDPSIFAGRARLYYGRWAYKFEQARKRGAVGCLLIHTTPSAGYPWQVVQTSWSGEQFDLPSSGGPQLQLKGWITETTARKLFALTGKDLDQLRAVANTRRFAPVPLGVTLTGSFTNVVARKVSGNVLGLLRGSDPQLKNEVVVYTAHHDHLGRKEGGAPGEDVIYNGAVDNASGVAAMLAVAKSMSALSKAPKRSVLFAAVAAEEQGLLGSQFLVEHPPFPPGRMAANLNLDGLNVWGRTRDLSVIGLGKSSLDAIIVELAKQQGRIVKPDALSDRGFFYRSDQFNFAKVGVPSAYFSSGQDFIGRPENWGRDQREKWESTHYHQPSDEFRDSWDLSGALEDVRLFHDLGLTVANDAVLPTWTRGDEFEAARKRARSE
jgi:Zn-dependent M28 family amino/carboxypeptidase